MTRYFAVQCNGELFGLFQSNHDGAIDLQIKQLLKNPNMVIKELEEQQYKEIQKKLEGESS